MSPYDIDFLIMLKRHKVPNNYIVGVFWVWIMDGFGGKWYDGMSKTRTLGIGT
jgi:hypothetical protein